MPTAVVAHAGRPPVPHDLWAAWNLDPVVVGGLVLAVWAWRRLRRPEVPRLGFRYDLEAGWSTPNPTGLEGVFEAFCPPHHPDMAAAVEAFAQRKFGPGGPYHPDTPGPWSDSPRVRGSAQVHSAEFKACVSLQAQYVYDTFGKFPGTVPSLMILNYVQAHHLDLEFYDR